MTPTEIPVLNHGYVALVDVMGDDQTAARCAQLGHEGGAGASIDVEPAAEQVAAGVALKRLSDHGN